MDGKQRIRLSISISELKRRRAAHDAQWRIRLSISISELKR